VRHIKSVCLAALGAVFLCLPAAAQWQTPQYSIPIGAGTGTGFKFAAPGTAGYGLFSNGASSNPSFQGFLQAGTGAATRTWNSKAADTLSVTDFGGLTSASAVTNMAAFLASANSAGADGKNINLIGGTYALDGLNWYGTATNSYNLLVQGAGNGRSFLQWSAGHVGNFAAFGADAYHQGVTLKDTTFDANGTANPGGGAAVTFVGGILNTLNNVNVINAPGVGINLAPGSAYVGLNMWGGQVLDWDKNADGNAGLTATGIYNINITGTEFGGSNRASTAAIDFNALGNDAGLDHINFNSNAQIQLRIRGGTSWTTTSNSQFHTGNDPTATQVGVSVEDTSEQFGFSNNIFFNLGAEDYKFTNTGYNSVVGGTAYTSTSRTQSVLLSNSSNNSIVGFIAKGTFSTGSIVESGTANNNSIIGGVGSVVVSGAGSKVVGRIGSDEYLGPLHVRGSGTYGIDLSGGTWATNAIKATGFTVDPVGSTTINTGTLAAGASALTIAATQPASPAATQSGIIFSIIGAGSASQNNFALNVGYNAGYTGPNSTRAGIFINANLGTGTTVIPAAGSNGFVTNLGVTANTNGTGTVTNVGAGGVASNGSFNFGLVGLSQVAKNSATNIAVAGSAINTGSSPVHVGGWFSLNQTTFPTTSAALIADNGAQTDAIFLGMDNGSTVFTIADGGNVTSTAVIRANGGFNANGSAGVSTTCTVTAANTYVFTFGLLTTKGANCT